MSSSIALAKLERRTLPLSGKYMLVWYVPEHVFHNSELGLTNGVASRPRRMLEPLNLWL
jgi:hypothetical protein